MPTALIVEDEPAANHLLTMLVRLRGYATDSAFTGREALDLAAASPPDVVLLDVMLPEVHGLDVCRALKADPRTAAVPVVLVSARVAEEGRVEGFLAGATDYVAKPYTPDQVFEAMARADAWRARVQADPDALTVPLGGSPLDPDWLPEFNRLRSALAARARPDPARAAQLGQFLDDLAQRAYRRGRSLGGQVAVLDYRRDADRITLTVRDAEPGLLDVVTESIPGDALDAGGPFDRIERALDADRGRITLTCHLG